MRKIFLLSLAVAALMECGLSAIPNVRHNKVKPEPRVVGVDQAHWWVKINRMSREGKPAQEIFDFINERSKQEQGKLLSNQKRLAADIFRGMVGVIENEFKSIGEVAPAQAFVPAPSHEKVTAYLYTRHLSTHPSQGAVRPVKGSTAMLVTMEKGAPGRSRN